MITKELFVETIESIRLQYEHDEKWSSSIGKLFPNAFDANLEYDNHFANNALLKLLQVQLKDDVSWIEYFMHELNFGKDYKDGDAMDENGQVIDLSDSGKLYDFLFQQMTISSNEWISVTSALPNIEEDETDSDELIVFDGIRIWSNVIMRIQNNKVEFISSKLSTNHFKFFGITHWMYLPQEPTVKKDTSSLNVLTLKKATTFNPWCNIKIMKKEQIKEFEKWNEYIKRSLSVQKDKYDIDYPLKQSYNRGFGEQVEVLYLEVDGGDFEVVIYPFLSKVHFSIQINNPYQLYKSVIKIAIPNTYNADFSKSIRWICQNIIKETRLEIQKNVK